MAASGNPSDQSLLHLEIEGKPQVALVSQERPEFRLPKFGVWEDGENYAAILDNAQRKKTNGQIMNTNNTVENLDMFSHNGVPAEAPKADLNAGKIKNVRSVPDPVEPQDVNNRAQHPICVGTTNKVDDHQLENASRGSNSGDQLPINRKVGRLQQRPLAGQESQTPDGGTAIPAWGVWHTEGFTGAFTRAKEERNTPPVNRGRFTLLDEESIGERARHLFRADHENAYGGGRRTLTVESRCTINNDVGQMRTSSWGFPASTDRSKTSLRKRTKLLQLWRLFQKKSASFFKKPTSVPVGN